MIKILLLLITVNTLIFGDQIEQAYKLIASGNYKSAEIIADSCILVIPKHSSALFIKALLTTDGFKARKLYKKSYHGVGMTDSMRIVIYKKLKDYHIASENIDSIEIVRAEIKKLLEKVSKCRIKNVSEIKKDTVSSSVDFASVYEKPQSVPKIKVEKKSVAVIKNEKLFYTIQTGAFGIKVNAENMSKKLKLSFKFVEIIEQIVGGRTFYKVRVGRFATEKDALVFAEKKLRSKGMKFRIVKL